MKKTIVFFGLLSIYFQLTAQLPAPLQVKEYILPNGLTVWINEDHSQPKAFGAIVVKAGSKDSPNTGIAHYFEHIMFKGTNKIGTINYATEKIYLDSIAIKYDELGLTRDEEKRKEIQKQINRLSLKASDYAIPNEFDRLISKYGGSGLNAGTSFDLTMYHNTFSPQYFRQWAEINSERIMNPVFRLFQSELETVYEEKNMYNDFFVWPSMEKAYERVFSPHPYMYSIIGSTENLKNPSLSAMDQFYHDYYVAGNMALILSGDIYASEILPVIESTFGCIRSGNAPEKTYHQPADFNGKEEFELKVPIPLVKLGAQVWRGVPNNHEDQIPLQIISGLMNNSNYTGYFDKLTNDRDVMFALFMNMEMNDAGVIIAAVMPKLMFQRNKKAKNLMNAQIERIKSGDFTEDQVEYAKRSIKKNLLRSLENINSRSNAMITVYSQGKEWNDYLTNIAKLDTYKKEDIVRVANKYLTNNYLDVTKKTGSYPKDELKKPEFEPIIPKHKDAQSEYARELEKTPLMEARPRFIDFQKDVETIHMSDKVTLYIKENPLNDIFTIEFSFGKGSEESKLLEPMISYLNNLGTDKYTYEEFGKELQKLGSTLSFYESSDGFAIGLSGFDNNFNETMGLLGHFISHVKGDKKQLKKVADEKKLEDKAFLESSDMIADALYEKVMYGDKSYYLDRLSFSEIKKLSSEDLLNEFRNILKVECNIHYCGELASDNVTKQINENFDVSSVTVASNNPVYKELMKYSEPTVYFIHFPKAKQSSIYLYSKGGVNSDRFDRISGNLFSSYFGGSMNSLIFQEIREFRSLAYSAGADYTISNNRHKDKPGYFSGFLSTQNDKTIEALQIMDSLIKNMPVKPERVQFARQGIINRANNNYPTFRQVSKRIASLKQQGFGDDPNKTLIPQVEKMDINNIVKFYDENVKNRPLVYMIVGDEKNIDMDKIGGFGKIIKVKPHEIYR